MGGISGAAKTMAARPLVVGSGLALIIMIITAFTAEVYDDPFILYRYAENLATGAGWTFNPGAPTENGVSSGLVVVVLAGLAKAGINVALGSALVFAAGMWSAAFSAYLILRREGFSWRGSSRPSWWRPGLPSSRPAGWNRRSCLACSGGEPGSCLKDVPRGVGLRWGWRPSLDRTSPSRSLPSSW